jgi:acyl-CoA dehydrogenase
MPDTSFLAWPFFDEAHRRLASEAEAWAAGEIAPLINHSDVDGSCRRLVRALGDAGWLRHAVPASHGGASEALDVRTLCLMRETLARYSGLADFSFAMQGLGAGPISLFGSDVLKARYLPPVARGEAIAAFAVTEPEAGSDVAALATTAVPDGPGHVRITGEKTWISNGGIADHYVVFARSGEAPGARGLSAFVVDADAPGLEIAERIEVTAPHPPRPPALPPLPRGPSRTRLGGLATASKSQWPPSTSFARPLAPRRSALPAGRLPERWSGRLPVICSARRWPTCR